MDLKEGKTKFDNQELQGWYSSPNITMNKQRLLRQIGNVQQTHGGEERHMM